MPDSDNYRPGSCNIGGAEVLRRRNAGILNAVIAVLAATFFLTSHTSLTVRALIFFPILGAAIGWFQTKRKFCLAYGFMGTFNFGHLGSVTKIEDGKERKADQARALKTIGQAVAVSIALTLPILLVHP